jgi:hypothetical protein
MTKGVAEVEASGSGFDEGPVPHGDHQLIPEIGRELLEEEDGDGGDH